MKWRRFSRGAERQTGSPTASKFLETTFREMMKAEVTFVDGALVRAGVGVCNSEDSDDFPEGWRNPP